MSHKTTRKGGRRWWGKGEAKEAGRVTRRRDDADASAEVVDVLPACRTAWFDPANHGWCLCLKFPHPEGEPHECSHCGLRP